MSQSLVNESAGARTPVSGLVAAVFTLFVVLFASGLLRNLPQPVLAAIVLAAVMSLVDIPRCSTSGGSVATEFFVAIAALLGVLGSGPSTACCLAPPSRSCCCSGRPRDRASPSWAGFRGRRISPIGSVIRRTNVTPGVLVVRCESSLLYFNVEYVRERLLEILARARRSRAAGRLLPRRGPGRSIWPAPSCWPTCTRRCGRAAWHSGSPTRMAKCATRFAVSGSNEEYGTLETGQTVDVVVSQWQGAESLIANH